MNIELVNRIIKWSLILTVVLSPFVVQAFGFDVGLGIMAGAGWGIASLWLLKLMVTNAFAKQAEKKKMLLLFLLKFPVLYLAGFFLMFYAKIHPIGALVGFSLPLAVTVLKSAGRIMYSKKIESDAGPSRGVEETRTLNS
tara:strand:+ start:321 stop:740 length:420 start_codon:yes stop_codon:yes gene_type:complete